MNQHLKQNDRLATRLRRALIRNIRLPLAFIALATTPLLAAELDVHIEGLADTGSIHVYVFISADGFPKEERAVFHQIYARPAPEKSVLAVRLSVPDSPDYAVMVFQDKDGNGKMNRLLGMIPQEPYGLSRNPALFGKPKFSEAAFKATEGERIAVKLRE